MLFRRLNHRFFTGFHASALPGTGICALPLHWILPIFAMIKTGGKNPGTGNPRFAIGSFSLF